MGLPRPVGAHVAESSVSNFSAWNFELWVVVLMVLSLALYLCGALQLTSRSPRTARQLVYFMLGWIALATALMSPVDTVGNALFAVHMVQHELLMIVSAPLLVLSRPFGVWLWALPSQWRPRLGHAVHNPVLRLPWRWLSRPAVAWIVHALALWLWHVPAWFDAALADNSIHTLQHLSFLVPALFFWWALLDEQAQASGHGAGMLYLFTTMMHTGALGALLTFSGVPWYEGYGDRSLMYGFTPLEDQQLGGLIMWVPGGVAYLLAGLVLGARWLGLGEHTRAGRRS